VQAVRGYAGKGSTDEHVEVFSFLFRHPFGFSGRYSRDMLEHHIRLNRKNIYFFILFLRFIFFFLLEF
jgi:hypothetical protein